MNTCFSMYKHYRRTEYKSLALHVAIITLDFVQVQTTIQKQFPFELSAYQLVGG